MSRLDGALGSVRELVAMDLNAPGRNVLRALWDKLAPIPGGKRAFSLLLGRAARYSGTVDARVMELREGYGRVEMADTPKVRNHLRSVHAIALVNLAEIAGNLALAYSLPADARFIVGGLSIDYLKKARGRITAEGRSPHVPDAQTRDVEVPVELRDASGEEVARATLRTRVGPKRA